MGKTSWMETEEMGSTTELRIEKNIKARFHTCILRILIWKER